MESSDAILFKDTNGTGKVGLDLKINRLWGVNLSNDGQIPYFLSKSLGKNTPSSVGRR